MSKEKKTAFKRVEEINTELNEILVRAKGENRDFTAEENARIEALRREKNWLRLEMDASTMQRSTPEAVALSKEDAFVEFVRTSAREKRTSQAVVRAGETQTTPPDPTMKTSDLSALQPLTVGDIIDKVSEMLIWNLIGIRIPTGLSGQYEWPIVGDIEAEFAGEGASLTDKKVDISKVAAVQQRAGVKASLTRESIFNSRGQLVSILNDRMPKSIAKKINDVMFSPTAPTGVNSGFQGPFVTATAKTVTFDFKGLNVAKADLLAKGYDEEGLVWVMDAATKAELEGTPKDTGSGIMTIEKNLLCGRPVFVCSKLNGKIGLGDFRYQVCGQFGGVSFVSDPFTKAGEDKVVLNLNTYFGTATLDKAAFMILTKKTS